LREKNLWKTASSICHGLSEQQESHFLRIGHARNEALARSPLFIFYESAETISSVTALLYCALRSRRRTNASEATFQRDCKARFVSFAPCGAGSMFDSGPTACAVGCMLSPLRGWVQDRATRSSAASLGTGMQGWAAKGGCPHTTRSRPGLFLSPLRGWFDV
jgi:hypothetical protein